MDHAQHAALVSEIAQLSGAIDRQRTRMARGSARGCGARGRGAPRGRGRPMPRPYAPHRSLVLNRGPADEWVRRRTNKSMALVNSNVYEPRRERAQHGNRGEVVVDGVPFVFDESGTRLVKKSTLEKRPEGQPPVPSATPPQALVPRQASINGEEYVRTKNGNLVSKALVLQRRAMKANQARSARLAKLGHEIGKAHQQQRAWQRAHALCTYYTRTGTCKRGPKCPFLHDDARKALCPGALKPSGCILPRGTCLLSHTPSAHNAPHCVHFLRHGTCRNGDACKYTHADLAPNAPVCREYSALGWCERGAQCTSRHGKEEVDTLSTEPKADAERPEPTEATLFVRDDAGADERYFYEDAHDAPHALQHSPTASQSFAQQEDFIGLDGDDGSDISDVSDLNAETSDMDTEASALEEDDFDALGASPSPEAHAHHAHASPADSPASQQTSSDAQDDAEVDAYLGNVHTM